MPDYRFYRLTSSGAIFGAGQDFDCAGDAAAIAKAREVLSEPFEVWHEARRVYSTNMAVERSHERSIVSRERSRMNRLLIDTSRSAIEESRELLDRTKDD